MRGEISNDLIMKSTKSDSSATSSGESSLSDDTESGFVNSGELFEPKYKKQVVNIGISTQFKKNENILIFLKNQNYKVYLNFRINFNLKKFQSQ